MEIQKHSDESMGGQTFAPQKRETQEVNRVDCSKLYNAACKGDWNSAVSFFKDHPKSENHVLNNYSQTALHVAAAEGQLQFVKKLSERMSTEALVSKDISGNTALHNAAFSGSTDVAKSIVRKSPALPQSRNNRGWTPLLCAATVAKPEQKDIVWYLCSVTKDEHPSPFHDDLGAKLICNMTASGFYDISLYLVKRYPHLSTASYGSDKVTVLSVMAERPSAFPTGSRLGFWQHFIYSHIDPPRRTVRGGDPEDPPESSTDPPAVALHHLVGWAKTAGSPSEIENLANEQETYLRKVFKWLNKELRKVIDERLSLAPGVNQVRELKLSHKHAIELVKHVCTQIPTSKFVWESNIFSTAIEFGIIELVIECLESFGHLNVSDDDLEKIGSMFHIAVRHRREKIFNLIYRWTTSTTIVGMITDELGNTMLHLAAKLAPSPQLNSITGAALQMQRELQWFKEVERLVQPAYRESKNKEGKTAQVIFTEEHKDLVEKGQKWMKETSSSCMVVATLIATVMFSAAFTVPGGNQSEGIPIFLKTNHFMIFAISDALALFSSLTSVLMFLSILTSRYAEEDFLYVLPKRLIIGLSSLFISIATMMIAFSTTLSIVLSKRFPWVSIPISSLACIPVTLFALLQFPLLVEIVLSTYGPKIFDRKN
ncbi:hypothetical protein HHK36_011529 [Tetracentron sinense]|uniref:PGG domain-containing protein n=1 Tax=Tetracentron sinense TaxID=13715 RepID=A0A834ZD49_TETSI|nr:hypothetical protein HHK36_011529 [Tetracentron sinense]